MNTLPLGRPCSSCFPNVFRWVTVCLPLWFPLMIGVLRGENHLLRSSQCGPVVVDFNPDNGRKDVLTPEAWNWQISPSVTLGLEMGDVRAKLVATGSENAQVDAGWWKAGYDYPARFCSDGATTQLPDHGLRLTLNGLSAGKHTLVTWHNSWDPNQQPPGTSMMVHLEVLSHSNAEAQVIWSSMQTVQPSYRVLHDDLAAFAYFDFDIGEGQMVSVHIQPDARTATSAFPLINGISLDAPDPSRSIQLASPAHNDLHTPEQPVLSWKTANNSQADAIVNSEFLDEHRSSSSLAGDGVRFHVFLGNDLGRVTQATPQDPEYLGTTHQMQWPTTVTDHLNDHYWRVDCESPDNQWTTGMVRRFRIRRLAFPGAEGYGRFAIGGRGGRVIYVSNLNDSGTGSLREAVEAEGPRTILFEVAGTIELKSKLLIRHPFLTIAGQSAPGDGICVSGYTMGCFGTHDVILRYIRLRVGDTAGLTMDGTGFASSDHVIFDHCSVSWSIDEAVSSRGAKNITLQRCIVAEALNVANHQKYQPGKGHSFAASISGDVGSFHHNLLAHCAGRNWSLAGGLDRGGRFAGRLDIRNNIVYNWEHRTNDGGVKALNLVNNLYLPGPASRVFHLLKPDVGSPNDRQQYFVAGNRMEGYHDEMSDNWANAVIVEANLRDEIRLPQPFCEPHVTTHSVSDLLDEVLSDVGANHAGLDAVDLRIVGDVRSRTASAKGSRTGLPGIIDSQNDVGGWPLLRGGVPPNDTDGDGLPDAWELAHGLDPNTPDQNRILPSHGGTALEVYLSERAVPKP